MVNGQVKVTKFSAFTLILSSWHTVYSYYTLCELDEAIVQDTFKSSYGYLFCFRVVLEAVPLQLDKEM